MSQSRVELLKARFKQEKEKKNGNGGGGNGYANNIYPFWQMDFDEVAKVRLINDSDPDNANGFFADKFEHIIALNGEDRRIPCLKTYGEECPICDLSKAYYDKDKKAGNTDKDGRTVSPKGKYFYRKKTSLVRVLVLEDPLPPDDTTGETFKGKVLMTQFGYQLMEKIKAEVVKGVTDDVDDFADPNNGYNFLIGKTKQGNGESTYVFASGFDRRPSKVPDEYRELITPLEFSSKFPKKIPYDTVAAMLAAHVTGEEYVEETDDAPGTAPTKPAVRKAAPVDTPSKQTRVAAPIVEEEEEESGSAEVEDEIVVDETDDIMEAIKRRRAGNK